MYKFFLFSSFGVLAPLLVGCSSDDSDPVTVGGGAAVEQPVTPEPEPEPQLNPALAGGDTTVFTETSTAFETPALNLEGSQLEKHLAGDVAFEDVFVTAPAPVNNGLGPVFNNTSCIRCHSRDGRGRAPVAGEAPESLLLRVSLGNDAENGPLAVQGFGKQLQHQAVIGVAPEVTIDVSYSETEVQFADGETISLREPRFTIVSSYESMPDDVLLGARIAPPVFGRGLLEAIPDSTLESWSDEFDDDGDGISGRPNRVKDPISDTTTIGRFGLKANSPSLIVQNAAAYNEDMGVTNSVFPVESAFGQIQHDELLDDVEISDETLDTVTFYVQTLAVPARRNVNGELESRGETLFAEANCSGCHIPQTQTGEFADVPEIANQTIFPYTDLLLHDMGEGLSDNRPDFLASGSEWRTPPLWGIGLTATVNGHTDFLHDGRARNVMEAIMWHGGEAESAKESVRNLGKSDRDALIAFVNSL